jgi:hypothetical protein
MHKNQLNSRPLIYKKDGYIGLSKIDGTPIILPNQYVMPKLADTLMPFCYPAFSEGIAPAALPDGSVGYIDEKGSAAFPFIYEYAYPFIDGYAAVKFKGKWGMIDRAGNEIVPFSYDLIFYEGTVDDRIAVVKNGEFGYVTTDGSEIIPCAFDVPIGRCSGKFSEGVAPVLCSGEVFFIDKAGKRAITLSESFDYVASFAQGFAMVHQYKDHHIYHGYIDKKGGLAVPAEYRQIGGFCSEGVVQVLFDGDIVYIDMAGHIVLRTQYDGVTSFHGNVAWGHKNGCWESFDREGKVLARNFHFDRAIPCEDNNWIIWSGKECQCVDAYGNELLSPKVVPLCPYLNLCESDWILYCLRR